MAPWTDLQYNNSGVPTTAGVTCHPVAGWLAPAWAAGQSPTAHSLQGPDTAGDWSAWFRVPCGMGPAGPCSVVAHSCEGGDSAGTLDTPARPWEWERLWQSGSMRTRGQLEDSHGEAWNPDRWKTWTDPTDSGLSDLCHDPGSYPVSLMKVLKCHGGCIHQHNQNIPEQKELPLHTLGLTEQSVKLSSKWSLHTQIINYKLLPKRWIENHVLRWQGKDKNWWHEGMHGHCACLGVQWPTSSGKILVDEKFTWRDSGKSKRTQAVL